MPAQRRPSPQPKKHATSTDPRRQLGLRIKELRTLHGLTQEELADRSGVFRTYMSRIESGQANPTLIMLYQIADAFLVDIRELFVHVDGSVPVRVNAKSPVARGRVGR